MTEYHEFHDPIFTNNEAGNPVVTHYPRPNDYVVTDRTHDWEQAIAEKAGLRLVQLNADGRVVTPQADYLNADDSVMDRSWRTIAAQIRNEFHPAPVERPTAPTNAGAAPKAEADPTTGTARLHKGIAPHITTETDADGATVTTLVRQAPRVEEAPQNYQRRTFNPDGLHMDDYMALRRQGLVPKVEVVGASRKTNTESFDLPAWLEWRAETTAKSEMEEFMEARSKGQVPAQKLRGE